MMKVACWKVNAGTYVSGDAYAWCNYSGADLTGAERFHPLLQNVATANTYLYVANEASTAKASFISASPVEGDAYISQTKQETRARAQVNLWFGDWVLSALDADWVLVGKDDSGETPAGTNKADEITAGTWNTRVIGAAEATQTTKQGLAAAAAQELLAVQRWKALATEEAAAAAQDLVRARTLLDDLIAEIAPLARAEA